MRERDITEPPSDPTADPAEWIDRTVPGDISNAVWWQNTRDPRAISHDGGKTYWMTHEANAVGHRAPVHRSAPVPTSNERNTP